jgi:hypothetical protein
MNMGSLRTMALATYPTALTALLQKPRTLGPVLTSSEWLLVWPLQTPVGKRPNFEVPTRKAETTKCSLTPEVMRSENRRQ